MTARPVPTNRPARHPARPPAWRDRAPVLAVVSVGGGIGAAARYAAGLCWPTPEGGFPWATFCVNAAGCAAIGVLLVAVTERGTAHPLVRPFLGTGVLGGFTTFSTYAVDVQQLFDTGRTGTALLCLAGTPLAALAAVWLAATAARRAPTRRQT
ncbi:fluoride efflux transporter CrcB [Streptomyces sp. NPDC006610]|uniref:fluoride efflux transporter CrcB n=1 Tax=Streptomyces sp. NPDC006610 TaxID=3154584 RepID=UPI0033BEEB64